jgi:hypothetical protein
MAMIVATVLSWLVQRYCSVDHLCGLWSYLDGTLPDPTKIFDAVAIPAAPVLSFVYQKAFPTAFVEWEAKCLPMDQMSTMTQWLIVYGILLPTLWVIVSVCPMIFFVIRKMLEFLLHLIEWPAWLLLKFVSFLLSKKFSILLWFILIYGGVRLYDSQLAKQDVSPVTPPMENPFVVRDGSQPANHEQDVLSVQNTLGSIRFIITSEMKEKLSLLGYSDDEVRSLDPQVAGTIVAKGMARWSVGKIPSEWNRAA